MSYFLHLIRIQLAAVLLLTTASQLTGDTASTLHRLDYQVTNKGRDFALRAYTDGHRWRYEMGAEGAPHTAWIVDLEQNTILEVSVLTNSYSRRQTQPDQRLGRPEGTGDGDRNSKWEIHPIGQREVLGRSCQGFSISTRGPNTDVWIDPEAALRPPCLYRIFGALWESSPAMAELAEKSPGQVVLISQKSLIGRTVFRLELTGSTTVPGTEGMFSIPEGFSQRAGPVRRDPEDRHKN